MEMSNEDKWWEEAVIVAWFILVIFLSGLVICFMMNNVCELITLMKTMPAAAAM